MHDSEYYPTRSDSPPLPEIVPLRPGLCVGQFELVEMLGRGGMGQAWKAVDSRRRGNGSDGFVVLKFLPDELRYNADATEEFQAEYRRVQELHHQHLCSLHDFGEQPGLGCFQVMNFLPGRTLRAVMKTEDPERSGLPIDRVASVLEPIAAALDYAHERKLIHRDIKPENIIVNDETGDVYLIDFGLASQVRTSMSRYSQRQMSTSGTAAYKSPEQWQGHPQYPASDQWSVAVVAWELLTGDLPFLGDGMELGFAVCQASPPDLPAALQHLRPSFERAMAKDRRQRFDSCTEFVKSLRQPVAASRILARKRPPLLGFPMALKDVQAIQQQWAEYLDMPIISQHSVGEMVLIPPGKFLMGTSHSSEKMKELFADLNLDVNWLKDEIQRHPVTITRPFLVGRSAVTVDTFASFVDATNYITTAEQSGKGGYGIDTTARAKQCIGPDSRFSWKNVGWPQTPEHPVVNITWHDAAEFLGKANKADCDASSGRYRLLHEAEWEYCARAGTKTCFYHGDKWKDIYDYANCLKKMWHLEGLMSSRVCQFRSNAFGLHDMLGNVQEWCRDWYAEDYYRSSPSEDPRGSDMGLSRILRGGAWNLDPFSCRAANRSFADPSQVSYCIGFRVLCEIP